MAVGRARIDNRLEIARLVECETTFDDLDLIVRGYQSKGANIIERLVGDFSFVIWDSARRQAIGAGDPVGVRRLFHRTHLDTITFASNLNYIAHAARPDEDFVASYLAGTLPQHPTSTIWSDCKAVEPGSFVCVNSDGDCVAHRYWWPSTTQNSLSDEAELCRTFVAHLRDAIASRIEGVTGLWSELSGGLDSSTVVAVATHLQTTGRTSTPISGTYSFVDSMAGADETRFVNAVVESLGLRNEQIRNPYPWDSDDEHPPITDEPRPQYPYWARDRRAERLVADAGGQVVLSGGGSDFYLTGNGYYLADLIARRRLSTALREASHLASAFRGSMWKALWRYGIHPELARRFRRTLSTPRDRVPEWISPLTGARVRSHAYDSACTLTKGERYNHFVMSNLRELSAAAHGFEPELTPYAPEKRYPFFHRPLIEFSLGLHSKMLLRGATTKWVLRQSVEGIVPELVRTRTSKGFIDGRTCWALAHQRNFFARLLRDPLVSQAGWVNREALERAVARTAGGAATGTGPLMRVLSLETWFAVREGRWPQLRPTAA